MEHEGPPLEALLHRIAEVPSDFLLPPRIGNTGDVVVPAVIHDLAQTFGIKLAAHELAFFVGTDAKRDRPRLAIALVLCWTVGDDWFHQIHPASQTLLELLADTAGQLAQYGTAEKYIQDPDRREELARLILARFGYRPAGETKTYAQDRLTSLSTVERNRVLRASRTAEERARAIREALARKAAEESADKWTRE